MPACAATGGGPAWPGWRNEEVAAHDGTRAVTGSGLHPLDHATEERLRRALPPACFRPVEARHLEEPRGLLSGQAALLLAPDSTAQVAAALEILNAARVPVVPLGGGTGLVGGQVRPDPPAGVILSLERMTRIRDISPTDNTITVEAGAVLAEVQAAAEGADRLFPLSLASEGSCRIGGNLATNAGGVNVLRYGNARDLCLGIEAVLPEGRVVHGLGRLRKDNTGYDLKNLLIGSEGTLGVITAAVLRLFPRPRAHATALVALRDPAAALELLADCQAALAGQVSAFELIHRQGLDFLQETGLAPRSPWPDPPDWMALIDLGLGAADGSEEAFHAVLEAALADGRITDALIARSAAQRQAFWTLRETIPEGNRLVGAIASHDISVPLSRIPEMIAEGPRRLAAIGDFRINCFGHLGDGNLHYNVFPPKGRRRDAYLKLAPRISETVYGLVAELGGSISAEHGIGRLKRDMLARFADPARLAAMRRIKQALDPNGIMNPGAVLETG